MGEYGVSRARLKRAVAHGEAMADRWNGIPNSDLFTLHPAVNPAGQGRIRLVANKPIPEDIPLLLGEMLYQMRSALDACLYQAAIYVTSQNPPPDEQKLEFPICSSASEFPSVARRRLSIFPQPVQDGIERIQPYNEPSLPPDQLAKNLNRCLGILHDWARKDRHRKLHILAQYALQVEPDIIVPSGVTVTDLKVMPNGLLGSQQDLVTFRLVGFHPGMVVSMSPNLLTNIGVDELPAPCHDTDTLQNRLQGMLDVVNSVITAFERFV